MATWSFNHATDGWSSSSQSIWSQLSWAGADTELVPEDTENIVLTRPRWIYSVGKLVPGVLSKAGRSSCSWPQPKQRFNCSSLRLSASQGHIVTPGSLFSALALNRGCARACACVKCVYICRVFYDYVWDE